jgi:hypothetical protein
MIQSSRDRKSDTYSPGAKNLRSTSHRKLHGYFHFDRNRNPVQQSWPVFPLPYRVKRRRHQQRMPGDEFHLRHVPLRIDDAIEYYDSLRSRLSCQRRVDRLYVSNQLRRLHIATNAERAFTLYWTWWWGRGRHGWICRGKDAPQHTSQCPTWNSSRNSSGDAGWYRCRLCFFHYFEAFRYHSRRIQFPAFE